MAEGQFSKVLILGAIAAASAFVVTVFIVLVCVGCQRKNKSKHPPAGEKGTSVNMQGTLRNPKMSSMSKSDTRLHEINRLPCNGNSVHKSRPASMDLLLLHTRRSQTDLRPSNGRQLPQIPTSPSRNPRPGGGGGAAGRGAGRGGGGRGGGESRDHTYTEVGLRNPTPCLDDGLYESVGVREGDADPKMPPAPPPTSANTPATVRAVQSPSEPSGASNGNDARGSGLVNGTLGRGGAKGGNGGVGRVNGSPLPTLPSLAPQDPVAAEYASIRKVKKVDKVTKKENNGADSQSDSQSSVGESPSALPPPLPRSQEFPRKPEPFHLQSFPKEAVFMGNGEQYIWKPPEEDDIITLHPAPQRPGETGQGQPLAVEGAGTYSTVCKPAKKKPAMASSGAKTLPRSFGGDTSRGRGGGRGRGVQAQARSQEEPCYEAVGDKALWPACAVESDPAYATIDSHRKRERAAAATAAADNGTVGANATLKRKKPPQQAAPGAPPQVPPAPPVRGRPGAENFYETVGEAKQGANASGTTTIFTFNDGMEMYVTGL